jgi:spore coat polysaccharide biosynthesis protein SpsF
VRAVAIVQARMGSTRLPGKVLRPLAGQPVLWHVLQRLRRCERLDAIAVATSTGAIDDPVATFAATQGAAVVRGPEDDVLARYLLAARALDADIVVRVTGDAPLVDPVTIDRLVAALSAGQGDYCILDPAVPNLVEGIDPCTRAALERLARDAGDDPVAREHVTAYFKQHPGFVRVHHEPVEPALRGTGVRLSVDTPADLAFLEAVYARLGIAAGAADLRDVGALLEREPALLRINAAVRQKDARARSRMVVLRCDGGPAIGLGHLSRCFALGEALRERHGAGICVALPEPGPAAAMAEAAGFRTEVRPSGLPDETWLEDLCVRLRADALVLDAPSGPGRAAINRWGGQGLLTAVIDDVSERRLGAALAFYPPVPQLSRLDWSGARGTHFTGWPWVILRRGFEPRPRAPAGGPPRVLVAMGGSDPKGLTLLALEAFQRLEVPCEPVFLLGPAFMHGAEFQARIAADAGRFTIARAPSDVPGLMASCELAVATFGVTAYELAAVGVPALHLCLNDDAAESARCLESIGAARSLGVADHVSPDQLAQAVGALLVDAPARARMAEAGPRVLDGRGAERIAAVLTAHLDGVND